MRTYKEGTKMLLLTCEKWFDQKLLKKKMDGRNFL